MKKLIENSMEKLLIAISFLLVGCNLNSSVELENSSKNLVKAQMLKTKIESAKIEIEHLKSINKSIKEKFVDNSYKSAILDDLGANRHFLESKLSGYNVKENCLSSGLSGHKYCELYETAINLKRIYELTDRIKEYNDQLNFIQ